MSNNTRSRFPIFLVDEAARKIQTERLVMPEFSVTGGQPSVINGSKDFCDWTRDDQTMAFQLEKHVGEVLGPYSKGLVSIGLAESLFEKGGNIYKVLELANRGPPAPCAASTLPPRTYSTLPAAATPLPPARWTR